MCVPYWWIVDNQGPVFAWLVEEEFLEPTKLVDLVECHRAQSVDLV